MHLTLPTQFCSVHYSMSLILSCKLAIMHVACTLIISESRAMPTKQRLRPWLERVINSGFIAGLIWLDDDHTKFRIPWVHSGKQDWTPESSQIFMVLSVLYLLL